MKKTMSISFKSSAYRMLKKMPGKLWYLFAEFIDNSISSYLQNRELLEKLNGPNYKLQIELHYDDVDEITITDNAAGIDNKNWKRALEPGDIPEDNKGLNEFGMGMKYSAVWLSNVWELNSRHINDDFERSVKFDYYKVINEGLEDLPYNENYGTKKTHGTSIKLTNLESNKLKPFPKKNIIKHLASIYRNFTREESLFFSKYIQEGKIEIIAFGDLLKFEESNFLCEQWFDDRGKKTLEESPKIEWKYEFDRIVTNPKNNQSLKFSGFIGILDKMAQTKNGFSYFRRGRVVEGSGDEKMYPAKISKAPGSFEYKRLFGEFHFDDVDGSVVESTFNKNSFQDQDFINYCIDSLPNELKWIKFPEQPDKKFSLLKQATNHQARFDQNTAEKTIKKIKKIEEEKLKDKEWQARTKEKEEQITIDSITNVNDDDFNDAKPIPDGYEFDQINNISGTLFKFKLKYWESNNPSADLYTLIPDRKISNNVQKISLNINLKHSLFENNATYRDDTKLFYLICSLIKCLSFSELVARESGTKDGRFFRNSINKSIELFVRQT